MTQTPEIRISPGRDVVALRYPDSTLWRRGRDGALLAEQTVEGWTPMTPQERAQEAEELASRTHEAMMAKYAEAAELRDALEAMTDRLERLAQQLEADARTGEYRGGSYAGDVLIDVAQRIRLALKAKP